MLKKESKSSPHENAGCNFYLPKRYILLVLGFWGIFNTFAMRVILSEAIVAMTNQTHHISFNTSLNRSTECSEHLEHGQFPAQGEKFKGKKYNWDSGTQGAILGSYYYGYIITQLPGGILAERFGAKWVFGGGVLATAIFCLLSPLAATWGTVAFIVTRVLQGSSDGLTIPAMNYAISTWSPMTERSRFSTITFSGVMVGTVVGMPVSGALCSTDFLGGWPSAFYIFGFVSCIWFVFWCFLIYETPSHHPNISIEELFYIEQNKDNVSEKKSTTPWKSILTSLPAWAVLVSHTGHNFGFLIMLTEIPTYLNTVLHFNLMSNGFLSALPFICETISAFAASFLADGLRKSKAMSITTIRKLLNSIGMFGPGLCLVGIAFSGCNSYIIIALLCVGMTLNGGIFSGFNVTHVDMCPSNPGTLYAITNAVSNLTGIIGPMVVSAFTSDGATRANWNKVFLTTAAMYIFCGGFYAIFGSAKIQEWDTSVGVLKSEDALTNHMNQKHQKTKL